MARMITPGWDHTAERPSRSHRATVDGCASGDRHAARVRAGDPDQVGQCQLFPPPSTIGERMLGAPEFVAWTFLMTPLTFQMTTDREPLPVE